MKFINLKSILISAICLTALIFLNPHTLYAQAIKEPLIADDVSQCGSQEKEDTNGKKVWITPTNCLFLEEPIGGKANWDLYLSTCEEKPVAADASGKTKEWKCKMTLWNGGSIPGSTYNTTYRGPLQAILTETPSRPYQGPFGLLYSYVGLIYAYMSGLIVGISVLFVVIGGIQMSTAGGDEQKFKGGKDRIVHAVVGIIIWFTASLILYTINPTFFAF